MLQDVNENYLFHGTNPESAQCIARDFFRMERAGSSAGCMFGPGIYLAENASKSDEYLGPTRPTLPRLEWQVASMVAVRTAISNFGRYTFRA